MLSKRKVNIAAVRIVGFGYLFGFCFLIYLFDDTIFSSVKFLSFRRNFLPKKTDRHSLTCSPAWTLYSCRKQESWFSISHLRRLSRSQATAMLPIPDLYHCGFSCFVQIAREKRTWPLSGYAQLSYLATAPCSSTN